MFFVILGDMNIDPLALVASRRRTPILMSSYLAANEKVETMDDLRFRVNFNLSKKSEIYHHS